jgi:hypothetical protein
MQTTVLRFGWRHGLRFTVLLLVLLGVAGCGPSNYEKAVSSNNLKQLALGIHAYRDAVGSLPPVTGKVPGPPGQIPSGLSWRFHILPYIEQNNVYQLALFTKPPNEAEPWNRPDLLGIRIQTLAPPISGQRDPEKSFYRVFVGGALFSGKDEDRGFPPQVDLGNTILIVEAGEAVPWTKPEELVYDPDKPLPPLGGLFPDGFFAAFADASVRFIPRNTDEKTIRAMITGKKAE